jgi:uncharacterized protein (TIGR02300 family)
MVGRPELGTKCACASCGERFYDLNRSPAVCAKCGATQPPLVVRALRPVRTNVGIAYMSRRPSAVIAEEEAEPVVAVTDDEDEGEDADDAADVPEIEADLDADVDPVIVRD